MLIETRPNWKKLERMYSPTPDETFYALDEHDQTSIVLDDFHEYAPRNLKVRDKAGELVPLRMNHSQLFFHHCIEQQKERTGRVRVILLKGRQWGGSTYTEGRFYWLTTQREGCNTFIFSHEEKSTNTLFEMVQRYHDHCFEKLKPITGKTNAKELVFPALDSKYEVATAGKKDVGRSKRVTLLHWSEMATSPNADGHKRGLLQTVPEADDTEIIEESTANGVGGTFHEDWLEAIKDPTWDTIAIFIPWYWHDEYRRKVPKGFKRTLEEEALVEEYGLDDEQLSWRRWKIRTMKSAVGDPEDAFKQEYPMNWQEAFLFSGSPVFGANTMNRIKKYLTPPKGRYSVDMTTRPFKLVPNAQGELAVWTQPNPDRRYVIGADVAKGLEHGDNSVAWIVDGESGKDVACWCGKIPAREFGDLLDFLGKLYAQRTHQVSSHGKRAFIVPEITGGYGDTTVVRLKNELHYPHVYQAITRTSDGHTKKQWGFDTTKNSKPILIDALIDVARNEPHNILDKMTWYEMSTFVRKFSANNPHQPPKMEGMEGKHDDRVIARALAALGCQFLYGKRVVTEAEKDQRERSDEARENIALGKKIYRSFARTKSSNPNWGKAKAKPRTLSEIEQRIKELEENLAGKK